MGPFSTSGVTSSSPSFTPGAGMDLLSAGLGIAGGLLGFGRQSSVNRTNLRIARENREWQERMSNTAYQRARKDMELANLNPILALTKQASTPAGNIATMQNEVTPAVTSAIALARLKSEVAQTRANTELTRNAAWKTSEEAKFLEDTRNMRVQITGSQLAQQIHDTLGAVSAAQQRRYDMQIAKITAGRYQNLESLLEGIKDAEVDLGILGKLDGKLAGAIIEVLAIGRMRGAQ